MPHDRIIRCITIFLGALFALTGAGLFAQQPAQQPTPLGVLVLKNGNVLIGSVQRQGEHYRIESEGSVLQVPGTQVEMACASLVDAYEQRRQRRVGNATDAHLELARWCLRHGLLAEAAREILDARTDDPGHPALRALDLQLQQGLADEASRIERGKNAVVQVAHAEQAAEAVVEPEPQVAATPQLQEQFVRSIQPMLIHSCTTTGCHHPNSRQQMQLDRWALEGSGIPKLISKNLDEVLAQVDVEDPASSPLMRRARQAHGMRNERLSQPLAPYQTAILLEWLNEAAGVKPTAEPNVAEIQDSAATPEGEGVAGDEADVSDAMLDERAQELLSGRKVRTAFTPRDAFDPEIFNRRAARAKASAHAKAGEEPAEQSQPRQEYVPDSVELDAMGPVSEEELENPPAEESSSY
ncbi:hypothetical protein [Lacipirellula parvula]|uniref:Uncharacterized protein n=1 Tax=Lacipirellula parvula TaxID=2650471 RepID=A0A5K7X789_9BACT|nr:hypothetical protein [Lacipirellula parvula]BBO32418.1 hypothetical protein PLANPX_2030 [Lacipirellula parvula]